MSDNCKWSDAIGSTAKCKIVQVPPRERLLSLDAIDALVTGLNKLPLPRREVVEWMTALLYGWIESGGTVVSGEGEDIEIYPGIADDAHGEDGSGVWISEQRRRAGSPARRRPRQSMLLRMQLYFAAFEIAGLPLFPDARRIEVSRMRETVRGFSPVVRARYRREAHRLRRECQGERLAYYSAGMRRLRLKLADEQAHWQARRDV